MQARSVDPVAHPRAIQPLDQNTEVRLKDNYYVVSHRDKSVKMCDNLLLFLFIWHISGHVSKSYYFQRVRATRNIMHVTLHTRVLSDTKEILTFSKAKIVGSGVI